jgi:hypothetical protein
MSDATWVRAQVAKTEEDYRSFAQTLRRLTEDRADLHRLWPDQAGREFAQRHLTPLLTDLDRVCQELLQQFHFLGVAAGHGQAAQDALQRLHTLAEELTLAVSAFHDEAARARDHVGHAREAAANAQAIAAEVGASLDGLR